MKETGIQKIDRFFSEFALLFSNCVVEDESYLDRDDPNDTSGLDMLAFQLTMSPENLPDYRDKIKKHVSELKEFSDQNAEEAFFFKEIVTFPAGYGCSMFRGPCNIGGVAVDLEVIFDQNPSLSGQYVLRARKSFFN